MPPLTPTIDPDRLRELKLAKLSDEGKEIFEALESCRNLAEKCVVITGTRFGMVGLAEYLRHVRVDREQCLAAGRALKAVGLRDEGEMCLLAAKMKPKAKLPWQERQAKGMLKRVKELRAKGALPPYQGRNPGPIKVCPNQIRLNLGSKKLFNNL
jgi:hypothetical protein